MVLPLTSNIMYVVYMLYVVINPPTACKQVYLVMPYIYHVLCRSVDAYPEQMTVPNHFAFKSVELYENQLLGEGAYGRVCRAKCDQLLCAAKVLHGALFQGHHGISVEENIAVQKFEQECALLSSIKHPCIMQYLGTSPHPTTRLPVLLMELMDESLTHYLERSTTPLPFNIEVSVCHDIAMAIAYLHNNNLIHRDVSSNNVLLIAGRRAKLTDFGMSRLLADPLRAAMLTQCPGTPHYMAPEAQNERHGYSEKLDVFSFGVLSIQVMTRKFPDPGPQRKRIPDSRYPAGIVEVPIPDQERRKAHISLINATHPLLSIALQCIEFEEQKRPTAHHLCLHIEKMQQLPQYLHADEKEEKHQAHSDKKMAELEKQLEQLRSTNKTLLQRVQVLESQAGQQHGMQLEWSVVGQAPCKLSRGSCTANGNKVYFNHNNDHQVFVYDSDGNTWLSLPECPYTDFGLVVINNLVTTVGGDTSTSEWRCSPTNDLLSLGRGQRWQQHFPAMPTKRFEPAVACTSRVLVVAGGKTELGGGRLNKVELMDLTTMQWFKAASLPIPVNGMSMSVAGQWLYMLGGFDERGASVAVFRCNVATLQQSCRSNSLRSRLRRSRPTRVWQACENLPVYYATCTMLQNELVAVGGMDSDHQPSDKIHIYSSNTGSWQVIGHMGTARYDCLVASVSQGQRLVVVGGCTSSSWESWTDVVEVGQ